MPRTSRLLGAALATAAVLAGTGADAVTATAAPAFAPARTWKLSSESECTVASVAFLPCSL